MQHMISLFPNFKDLGTETWERMDPREILNESEQAEGRHAS
jgi:hypothetical protein